ncbi:imidazolonepropionase [Parabacteroides sp. PFB2-12]|uniref:imidazolonepropionase n=1 Tax=unclassified Parabacteroides TaxID=2649774 RepID=UPI002474434C|nr:MULTISPECIES: imidazolonepropionase [unclassified Parabacteroides]MDH6341755.1 imidazolonepropionase [Parabacteroides sp. PM6-13]MDH6389822.1 imidazolonepropionase [Parabacteroides sp. PFB2-12]
MQNNRLLIRDITQLVTCSGFAAKKGEAMSELSIIENGAVAIEDGRITHVGTTEEVLEQLTGFYPEISGKGKALLPGFVDSHTHFVFGGYREEEFSWRLRGDSYMSIMERGGGIVNTMKATRESSFEELYDAALPRLDEFLAMGVTTVEGKSGYGLDLETEALQLQVMASLRKEHPIDIVSTYLGAHALPPEFAGRTDEFVDFLIAEALPNIPAEWGVDFCDVFCEKGVFSLEQSERLLSAARAYGFALKLHADEIVPLGGAELAARLKAVSADHLLHASDEGIRQMAENDVVATLLPLTAFSLKEPYARGREMIDAGGAVALASDLNPGSCFSSSIPMLIAIACIYMQLSPEEAVTALTINGAAALNRADRIGSIDVGKQADMILLQYPSYKFLPYHFGMNIVETVIKKGKIIK